MLHLTPWAMLAISSLAHAQMDTLQARGDGEACCPCSQPGAYGDGFKTITVTEPAGPSHTVTVTQPAGSAHITTVYISQGVQYDPPTETVTVVHTVTEHGDTVYVTKGEEHVVTKEVTIRPVAPPRSTGQDPSHTTVAIVDEYPMPSEYAVPSEYDPEDGGDDYVVTRTVVPVDSAGGKKTITLKEPEEYIITKTIREDGDDQYYTVIVRPEPSVSTVTLKNGDVTSKVFQVPQYITVTAAPVIETVAYTRQKQNLETVTRTMIVDGKDEVEIIIIDRETGKSTCKRKESGLPCHPQDGDDEYPAPSGNEYPVPSDYEYPVPSDYEYPVPSGNGYPVPDGCDPVQVSTSIKTVYNTIVVTVGTETNETPTSTMAVEEPTSTRNKREARMPRAPGSKRWW